MPFALPEIPLANPSKDPSPPPLLIINPQSPTSSHSHSLSVCLSLKFLNPQPYLILNFCPCVSRSSFSIPNLISFSVSVRVCLAQVSQSPTSSYSHSLSACLSLTFLIPNLISFLFSVCVHLSHVCFRNACHPLPTQPLPSVSQQISKRRT